MISSTSRSLTDEEIKVQMMRLPSVYKRFEGFILKFIFIVMVLLIPPLVYDHFSPVPSNIQAVYCIVVVAIAIMVTFWITKKWEGGLSNSKEIVNIKSGQVEVVRVTTSRAIKRADPEDFGVAYYLEVFDNGKSKTLYLWGQYLDVLEYENIFPNSEFEFIRKKGSDEFIDFKPLGKHFKEEKTLPAFEKTIWKSGNFPMNGQILDHTIDEVT